MELERRRVLDSDGLRLEVSQMGCRAPSRGRWYYLPLRSLRAGMDSQFERTGALIQTLRDDVRLLTFLKSDFDAEIELELLDNRHNS